jgi:hypothetical protein
MEEDKNIVTSEVYESNVMGISEVVDGTMVESLGESAVNPFEEDIQEPGSSIENVPEIM